MPQADWLPWLKEEMRGLGISVTVPRMPHTDTPSIDDWVPYLSRVVGSTDDDTYFVGHSIGCQTFMRYLEQLPDGAHAGGAVFVAPWFTLRNLTDSEQERIALPWVMRPIDASKVRSHCNEFIALFSDDDPWVPLSDERLFKKELNAKTVILGHKGHFTGEDGIDRLPEIRGILKRIIE